MSAQFDYYVRGSSPLHRLDPRVKLLFVVEASILLFVWPNVWTAAGVAALVSLAFWHAKIPARHVVRVWRLMAPLMLLVFVLTALFTPGEGGALFQWGPIVVTPGGILHALMLAVRLLALALLVFLLLFTTDQASMVRSMRALGVPYTWALTLSLALRYLPIFAGIFYQIREAQQARGLELEGRSFWGRLTAYRPILVTMVIQALRQSEQLGWALEVRAVGSSGVRRTTFRPLSMTQADRAVALLLVLGFLAAVAARILVLNASG